MKIQSNKKNAFLILLLFVLILSIVLFLVLYAKFSKEYPNEPLKLENLGKTEQTIDISTLEETKNISDVPVLYVQPKIHIGEVEQIIDEMGLSLEKKELVANSFIEWSDEENTFTYDSVQDIVTFQLTRQISLERGEKSFSTFFEKYLGLEYEYILENDKSSSDGGITYYASRLYEDIPIQFGANYEYSDILKFNKEGYLQSGQILLTEIEKYDLYLPVISLNELKKNINISTYPKEHYIDTSVIVDQLDIGYLDEGWEDIENSLEGCKSQDSELIYLYKNSNQGYLLPVFKIYSNCSVTYKGNEYTVPATFYVNGADPNYVTL